MLSLCEISAFLTKLRDLHNENQRFGWSCLDKQLPDGNQTVAGLHLSDIFTPTTDIEQPEEDEDKIS
ncbi:CLUMA_CG011334, isoform A [Clunio marinus]|uniref:CLUMA_CG011334, isoform A n=1 Tax=Clunio marinus TaxID=568069 RepID=A0A1J1IDW7_9DIPT|nr:CLUMA_CG011334, isoform A [Clunio marinus]